MVRSGTPCRRNWTFIPFVIEPPMAALWPTLYLLTTIRSIHTCIGWCQRTKVYIVSTRSMMSADAQRHYVYRQVYFIQVISKRQLLLGQIHVCHLSVELFYTPFIYLWVGVHSTDQHSLHMNCNQLINCYIITQKLIKIWFSCIVYLLNDTVTSTHT